MRIVVVGGGAIGLLVAGRLAQARQNVALLARASTEEALRSGKIQIVAQGQTQNIDAPAVAIEPGRLPTSFHQPDLAILCVKSYDTSQALVTLGALRPRQILTLQNGIGNEEALADHFGAEWVLSGAMTTSVEIDSPALIRITKIGGIGLAAVDARYLSLPTSVASWGDVLRTSGFVVREHPDYRALKWSKVLLNILGNAIPTILDMSVVDVFAHPQLVALERQAFLEALSVMQQQGIHPVNLPAYPVIALATAMRMLPHSILFPLLRRLVARGRGGKVPSLHADLRQRRPFSEGAYLNGGIARAAREAGLAAPLNALLWQILQAIVSGEQPWDTFRQCPEQLLQIVSEAGVFQPQLSIGVGR